ncbi:class I glutamine amidotransferase-like protein, partial [Ophiobolus disseminans]
LATPCKPNLLLFSKTAGYRHASIADGIALVTSIATSKNWTITATEDTSLFAPSGLSPFTSLIFLHTTGDFLSPAEFDALHAYLLAGGSRLGIHAAGDFGNATPPWYNTLVGGQFEFHPCAPEWTCSPAQLERYPTGGNIRPDTVTVETFDHPLTAKLPKTQRRVDEWYSYRTNVALDANYTVLATLEEIHIDEITPEYLSMKPVHPISWYSLFEGKARAWYTGMGHTSETYAEEYFREHVEGGWSGLLG